MNNFGDAGLTSQAPYLPLLIASSNAATDDGHYPLNRIRMQKAIFLVTRSNAGRRWHDAYPYRPYNWGPYSAELNEDLSAWQRDGLMILSFAGDARYGRYVLTRHGASLADNIWAKVDASTRNVLINVRSWVTSKDFNSLLAEVYEEFPEYATKSRWSGTQ
jgi:uncharacterized protein YwgA